MLMYMFVDTRICPCYMYIHDDGDSQALVAAHSLWTFVRGIMVERLSFWRGGLGTWTTPRPSPPSRWHGLLLLPLLCSPTSAMRVVSWNVQGMGGPQFMRSRGYLRQEL